MPVRLALDAMGGDHAPKAMVEGAYQAVSDDPELEVLLVGPPAALTPLVPPHPRLAVVASGPGVPDGGHPAHYLRRHPDASMARAVQLVAEGAADGAVAVGHTGALMVAARWHLGTLPGIDRPAPAGVLALGSEPVLVDLGANTEGRPSDLLGWAALGAAYAAAVRGVASPRVGLLANGTERGKGTEVLRQAYDLFAARAPGFVGYVEPVGMFEGAADVVVVDGFTGNMVLKTIEGVARALGRQRPDDPVLARLTDVTGGDDPILLLGVRGVVVPGHGRAGAADVARLLHNGARAVRGRLVATLTETVARFGLAGASPRAARDGEGGRNPWRT
jgi:glycerol-3-phosphate acyltransferase PlsX